MVRLSGGHCKYISSTRRARRMKCWWAATILLICLFVGTSYADWIILRVDLGKPALGASNDPTKGGERKGGLLGKEGEKTEPFVQQPGTWIYVVVEAKN